MNYKALICDVDGTLTTGLYDLPSKKLLSTLKKAQKMIHVATATSRPYRLLTDLFYSLDSKGPSIINGGAQIIEASTGEILWEQVIAIQDVLSIGQLLTKAKLPFIINEGYDVTSLEGYIPKKPIDMLIFAVDPHVAENAIRQLSHFHSVVLHKIPAWEEGKIHVHITNIKASKEHAVIELAKLLKISTKEIIGVGDGYIPLIN